MATDLSDVPNQGTVIASVEGEALRIMLEARMGRLFENWLEANTDPLRHQIYL